MKLLPQTRMLCCALCGSGVCRGDKANQCGRGVLYQTWGPQGVIPAQMRVSFYKLNDHYDAVSSGKRGFEDFRAVCCACHLTADYHLNRAEYEATACARCKVAVDGGFRNIRHHARVLRMVMR